MTCWKNTLAKYKHQTAFATESLLDDEGQSLIGVYGLKVLKIRVKYTAAVKNTAILCCSLFTCYKENSEGIISKVYAPVDIFKLEGSVGQESVLQVAHDFKLQFSDVKSVSYWLEDRDKKKLKNVELDVLMAYKKW